MSIQDFMKIIFMTSNKIGCPHGFIRIVFPFISPSLSTFPHYNKTVLDIIFKFSVLV